MEHKKAMQDKENMEKKTKILLHGLWFREGKCWTMFNNLQYKYT